MRRILSLFMIVAALLVVSVPAVKAQTQTFTKPYYVSLSCYNDPATGQLRFQNGEFDFERFDANGTVHFYKFFAFAPSNLNHETPQLEVLGIMPLTDGTWTTNPPNYSFAAGELPSATVAFTISKPARSGCTASNVVATLTANSAVETATQNTNYPLPTETVNYIDYGGSYSNLFTGEIPVTINGVPYGIYVNMHFLSDLSCSGTCNIRFVNLDTGVPDDITVTGGSISTLQVATNATVTGTFSDSEFTGSFVLNLVFHPKNPNCGRCQAYYTEQNSSLTLF